MRIYAMNTVEQYIARSEPELQERLRTLRQLFFDMVPDTEESIRYTMPSFRVGRHYLYFGVYKKYIGFYPVYGLPEIEDRLTLFRAKGTKDTLHFRHNQPLPVELIREIIRLRMED